MASPLLPLFLSCRAAVRAKTSASAALVQPDEGQRRGLHAASREYVALAQDLLRPQARLPHCHRRISGSGKSTLARGLAPFVGVPPGALVVRSDVIRKTLLGVSPLTRLGPEGYTADVNGRVYETMAMRTAAALRAGHSVIADAVFARPDDRAGIASVAQEANVPFIGLWIDGPQEILAARLRERVADPSDATADVLDRQARAKSVRSIGTVWMDRATPRGYVSQPRRRCDCRACRHSAFRDDASVTTGNSCPNPAKPESPGKSARASGKFRGDFALRSRESSN